MTGPEGPGELLARAADVLAVDPVGLGGALLKGRSGPERRSWLDRLRAVLPQEEAPRRIPASVDADALLGGLDLDATLARGSRVGRRALLESAEGRILVVPMAERLSPEAAATLASALDRGGVRIEREGISREAETRFALVALDESAPDEPGTPSGLTEQLALHLDVVPRVRVPPGADDGRIQAARRRLEEVEVPDSARRLACLLALSFGITSMRTPLQLLRVARVVAALEGRGVVGEGELELASRWVIPGRARALPASVDVDAGDEAPGPDEAGRSEEPPEGSGSDRPDEASDRGSEGEADAADPPPRAGRLPPPDDAAASDDTVERATVDEAGERLVAAVRPLLPDGLASIERVRAGRRGGGRRGAEGGRGRGGRTVGARPGRPGRDGRLHLPATLRAAAPWQALRRRAAEREGREGPAFRVDVADLHVRVEREPSRTAAVFAVDASGSQALRRLGEVKGAVELLLADSYVRREEVALVAFRGRRADLLLPPTRSPARARRLLAGLPGGGGTPLAAGLHAASRVADELRRREIESLIVVLTDGRANVDLSGAGGRSAAHADALSVAGAIGASGVQALLIDTSRRGDRRAKEVAAAMRARYEHLPVARARSVRAAVDRVRGSS